MAQETIDLRSDTVTQPTPAMRQAMARAEVGDDVFGEDPTVRRLEEMSAARMAKEAAVFVASGTMGNLTAVLAHCRRGDEAICGAEAHLLHYEAGGVPGLGGIELRAVPNNERGALDLAAVESTIRGGNIHCPRTALVCLENTQNRCGGGVITVEETNELCALAHRYGCAVHLDGARVFNAAVALGVDVSALVAEVDSVTFCFSKGLSAPVGSVVCGSADFISHVRRMRKMVGGGMRQAGIIAAAGIVALEEMVDRLAEDHEHARLLADGLTAIPGIRIDPDLVETNIVVFEVADGAAFQARLREAGVLTTAFSATKVRMVTHYGVERADIEATLERVRRVAEAAA
jgi:threonine aldolase